MAPDLLACCYMESVTAQNYHYATAFVPIKVLHSEFTVTFMFASQNLFFFKRDPLSEKVCFDFFQHDFYWNQVKFKNTDYYCLFHCINVCQVPGKMFEHWV